MTGPSGAGRGARPGGRAAGRAATLVGGAAVISAVTVLARVVGFGRWLVFAHAVAGGASCLGGAYSTANMLPNIVFEVVAGGALAGAVVPLVAGPLTRHEPEVLTRTVSALLGWVLLVLLPVSLRLLVLSWPLMNLLVGSPAGCDRGGTARAAAVMFALFSPQVLLYGLAVVASGVLNAHRRFLPPALAPLLSSAVVMATYLAFAAVFSGNPDDVAAVPDRGLVVLGIGTTAGVVVLALTSLVPMLRLGLRVRPTLRFPDGVARRARSLALAGLAALVAQQVATLVVVLVANGQGERGALNTFNYAWAVYLLPYAVLAVPVATTAFTALSEHVGGEDTDGFRRTAALTSRAVALVSCLGAGLLAATALPVARTFGVDPPEHLAWALVAFAPGLVGYGLLAHWSRALYALGGGRAAAVGTVAGWAVAAVLMVVLGLLLPPSRTVVGIGAATSVGMTLAGVLLGRSMARAAGAGALAGAGRAVGVGVAGAALGGALGGLLSVALPAGGFWVSAVEAVAVALVAAAVVGGVVLALDGGDARAVLRRRFAS